MLSFSRLYECLCDIRITKCALQYERYEPLSTEEAFPLYYLITTLDRERQSDVLALHETYSSSFMCDTHIETSFGVSTCRRKRRDDNTCDQRRCKEYAVELSHDTCSFACGKLIWAADYELKIVYFNFGDIPEPVEDGICPEESDTAIVTPNNYTTLRLNMSAPFENYNDTIGDPEMDLENQTNAERSNREVGGAINKEGPDSDSNGFSFPMSIVAGAVGGGILILVVVTVICSKGAEIRKWVRSENPGTLDATASSSELRKSEATSSSSEDLEKEMYHTLDDMADTVGHQPHLDDCDGQGYDFISDYDTDGRSSDESRNKMGCRPLPRPPNSVSKRKFLASGSSTGSSTGQSSSFMLSKSTEETEPAYVTPPPYMPTIKTASTLSSRGMVSSMPPPRPHVRRVNLENNGNNGYLTVKDFQNTNSKYISSERLNSSIPPPRPPVRLVNLENLKSMGLVKLRQDEAMFGHETEVKLIRTQQGNLELVNVQEELPSFMEYYTRLQLIKQKDGSVGVIGLLNRKVGKASDESLKTHHLLNESGEHLTTASPHDDPLKEEGKSQLDEEDTSNPYIIYFGSMELEDDASLDHCDYLTIQDFDPSDLSPESDGYLTLRDLDHIHFTASSQAINLRPQLP